MTQFIALLRAVNVGGTGKLPMTELKAMCEAAGFEKVKTYIASGNVVFVSPLSETAVKTALEAKLADYAGKQVPVMVRTAGEMETVAQSNPFAEAEPNRVTAIFLDAPPPSDALEQAVGQTVEVCALGAREIYVHYPSGQANTKLRIPAARDGTARNMNTVAKLVEMAAAL
jgi:uncharacterized protein (DUF1697 family)